MNQIESLEIAIASFSNLDLIPIIGIELEFYLTKSSLQINSSSHLVNKFILELSSQAISKNISILDIEKESGNGQIELKTKPYSDIIKLCLDITKLKNLSANIAKKLNLEVSFLAQPFSNDCGSSTQVNISFLDQENNNIYAKNGEKESSLLLNSIGGILENLIKIMPYCSPNKEDLLRHNKEINVTLFKAKKYPAPINVSWGYDNRTTAIRVPTNNSKERRIEFRVPSSNANIYQIIDHLLLAIKTGIENNNIAPEPIYGNAFDDKYDLISLSNH